MADLETLRAEPQGLDDTQYVITGGTTGLNDHDDSYASTVMLALESISVDGTSATITASVKVVHNSYYGGLGPFYPSIDLEMLVDGTKVWQKYDYSPMLGTTITFEVTVTDVPPGEHTATYRLVNGKEITTEYLYDKVIWESPGVQATTATFTTQEPFSKSDVTAACESIPSTVVEDERATISGSVSNKNSVDATATVTGFVGGTAVGTDTVTVSATGTSSAEVMFTPQAVGLAPKEGYDVSLKVTSASPA